jgi:hypothetical protein
MKFLRQSRITTGSHILLIFNQMEDQLISDALLPTQDGGNYSKQTGHSLQTLRTTRLLQFQVDLTMKTEISLLKIRMERFTNNGRSSMLTSMKKNQPRDNSIRSSVSMLKETSMLSLHYQIADTLT